MSESEKALSDDVEPTPAAGAGRTDRFDLTDDDRLAIETAIRVARRFLADPRVTPKQIIGLGEALEALERMPESTSWANCQFGLSYRADSEHRGEMRFVTFRVSDDSFEISRGGSVHNPSVGNETFSEPGWEIDVGGYASRECDLDALEDQVFEFLNLGAEITVDDK